VVVKRLMSASLTRVNYRIRFHLKPFIISEKAPKRPEGNASEPFAILPAQILFTLKPAMFIASNPFAK
jgi:hypothetical protein